MTLADYLLIAALVVFVVDSILTFDGKDVE